MYEEVLPEVFRTDRATKERGLCDKNRRESSDKNRANEVNKGFIIWRLCWIAVCSDFVEKNQKHFRCYNFQPYILAVSGSVLAVTTKQ